MLGNGVNRDRAYVVRRIAQPKCNNARPPLASLDVQRALPTKPLAHMKPKAPQRDAMSEQLQRLLQRSVDAGYKGQGADAVGTLLGQIRAVIPVGGLNGEPAHALLREWIQATEAFAATRIATVWAPYRWLWYLRRTGDDIFRGNLPTTQRYDRTLTEALCVQGDGQEAPHVLASDSDGRTAVGYPIAQGVANTVAFACGFGVAASRLHACLRSVAKDATLHVETGIPTVVREPEEQEAVEAYDARSAADQQMVSYLGTFQDLSVGATSQSALGLFMRAQEPYELTVPPIILGREVWPSFEGNYVPAIIHLGSVATLMRHADMVDPALWHPDLAALVALASLSMLLVVRKEMFLLKSCMNGYDLVRRDRLAALFDEARPDILDPLMATLPGLSPGLPRDGNAFVVRLLEMTPSGWPLVAGPVAVPADDDQIALNMGAASDRLIRRIELPNVQGAVANIRSVAFEESVQERIDRTTWAPPRVLRELVRRQLRKDRKRIGECDAVAHKAGKTILVSCKARPYTLHYDAGIYSDVRNATTALTQDVAEWERFVRDLGQSRRGDNYDLESAGELIGVVVTPHVLYVRSGTLTRMADTELRTYSSAGELMAWLEAH